MPTKGTKDTQGQVVTEVRSFTWWVNAGKSPQAFSFSVFGGFRGFQLRNLG